MAYGGSGNEYFFSDETFDLLCSVCVKKGKTMEAEKYCLECNDYYCLKCVNVHEEIPALTKHKILDKADFPSGSIKIRSAAKPDSSTSTIPPAPTTRCEKHHHHYTDMYCQNHDNVGCGTCMAVDHRSCNDVFYIPEFLHHNRSASSSQEIKENLNSTFNTLKVHQENLQTKKKRLLTKKAKSLEDIRKFRKEINDRLDELEQNSLTEVENKYSILINEIEEAMELLDTMIDNVSSARGKITAICENVSQDFVNAKKGKRVVQSAAECLEESQTLIKTKDIEIIAEQKILVLLQDMNALVKVIQRSKTATEATENDRRHQIEGETQPDPTEQREPSLQVKGSHSYSVKVKSDRLSCNIVSACTMEDGTIILSDKLNKKLKRFDSSTYTVTDYCDLPGAPQQVCPINMQQVAVCLPVNKQITFTKVGKGMTISNKITMDFECYGLAHACNNLYISDLDKSVYIYNLSGQKLKQFSNDQSGQAMFSDIYSLAVTEDGSRIYVTDWNIGLIIMDNNGQVVGKFSGSQLNGAWGCFLTGRGSLLVCGSNSKNVLQFGLSGELIGEVVNTPGNNKAICCNKEMSKMVVAQDGDSSDYDAENKIKVFNLS